MITNITKNVISEIAAAVAVCIFKFPVYASPKTPTIAAATNTSIINIVKLHVGLPCDIPETVNGLSQTSPLKLPYDSLLSKLSVL